MARYYKPRNQRKFTGKWKQGKVFKKGRRKVRYIYPNGKKKGRKLVSVSSKRRY